VLFEKGNKEKIFFHEIKLKVGIDVYEVGLFAAVEKEVNFNRQKRGIKRLAAGRQWRFYENKTHVNVINSGARIWFYERARHRKKSG